MKINRHNYEEFFVLYIDNELQPEERKEVEDFVAKNPDLSDELKAFQSAVLPVPEISFYGKSALIKKEAGISLANYETYFLLYVDNELTAEENREVETFVLKHPELQQQFTLLKKSVLEPENIVFAEKGSLYKHEKVRRLIPLVWMRISVAAAITGLIAMVWIFNESPSDLGQHRVMASGTMEKKNNPEKNIYPAVTNQINSSLQQHTSASVVVIPQEKITTQHAKKKVESSIQKATLKDFAFETAMEKKQVNELSEKQVIVKEEERIPQLIQPEKTGQTITAFVKEGTRNDEKRDEMIAQARMDDKPALVTNAVYKEIDTNEDDQNLYVGSVSINKNKLKGFFRKASRLLGKGNNNPDEN